MLVLIDESGDAGFKIAKGSSPYFVVSMVIFYSYDAAEKVSKVIAETRNQLGVKPEFKFNKSSHAVRDAFFTSVSPFHFSVRAVVVHKDKVYSQNLRENKEKFYNYFIQLLLKHDNNILQNATIKIDGSGNREFKRELSHYLKKQIPSGKIKSVKFAESHRDNLIQLADMTTGAIARSYKSEGRKLADRWRKMLAGKINNVWDFE